MVNFCERLMFRSRSRKSRVVTSLAIVAVWYLVTRLLEHATGSYFHAVSMFATVFLALGSGFLLSLILTGVISLAGDYLYMDPIGTVLKNRADFERLVIDLLFVLAMNLLISVLRGSFQRALVARQDAESAKQEAERATMAMEQVLALVSHDIRNPLAASKMAAELILLNRDRIEDHHSLASKIVDNMARVDSMIQSLLDVSQFRAGKVVALKFEYCDLCSIVSKSVEDLVLVYGNRFKVQKPESVFGYWSPEGMRRAVENLITNAVKYGSSSAPIDVTITQQGAMAVVSVHNMGIEIPAESQAKLFDSYFQTDSAKRSGVRGWGLGLSLVKGIAGAHSGTVTVESRDGYGTTFSLKLPIRKDSIVEVRRTA